MKSIIFLIFLLMAGLLLMSCGKDDNPTPTVAMPAEEQPTKTPIPTLKPTATARPTDTPPPTLKPTATAKPTDTPEPALSSSYAPGKRPYRSYPAPTGLPGFRLYYQKRCYPGCHSYSSDQVHP